jgi:hypothetical protein
MMKSRVLLITLLALLIGVSAFAQPNPVYVAMEKAYMVGGLKDSLYSHCYVLDLRHLDSAQLFIELPDSGNVRTLGAGIFQSMTTATADTVKDTVLIRKDTLIKRGMLCITWNEIVKAFGGAVPPVIKLYVFVDQNASSFWRRLLQFGVTVKEYPRRS